MSGIEFVNRIDNLLLKTNKKRTPMLLELNLPRTAMINWYKNDNIPAGDIVYKLSKYLDVSINYLLTGEEEEKELSFEEKEILSIFNSLTEEKKALAKNLLKTLQV